MIAPVVLSTLALIFVGLAITTSRPNRRTAYMIISLVLCMLAVVAYTLV